MSNVIFAYICLFLIKYLLNYSKGLIHFSVHIIGKSNAINFFNLSKMRLR